MITFDSSFTAACNKSNAEDLGYIIDLYSDDESNYMRFSTHDFSLTTGTGSYSKAVYGCVKSVSDITSTIDPHDCSYSVSNCTFTLAEGIIGYTSTPQGTLTSLLALTGNAFRNRKVEIKYYLKNTGYTAGSSFPTIFDGTVKNFSFDYENQLWSFECVCRGELKHKDLPATLVNKTDYPLAPEASLGMPIPILCGDFEADYGSTQYDFYNQLFHMAPSVCVDESTGKFLFASHEIANIDSSGICVFFDSLDTYGISLSDETGSGWGTVTTAGADYTFPTAKYFVIADTYLTPKLKGSQNDVNNITNAIDGDYSTSLSIAGAKDLMLKFQGIGGSDILFPLVFANSQFYLVANFDAYSGTASNVDFYIYNALPGGTKDYYFPTAKLNGTGLKSNYIQATGGAPSPNINIRSDRDGGAYSAVAQMTWDEIGRYEWGIRVSAGTTIGVTFFSLNIKNLAINSVTPLYIPRPERQRQGHFAGGDMFSGQFPQWVWVETKKEAIPTKGVSPGLRNKVAVSNIFATLIQGRMVGATIGGRAGNTLSPTDLNYLSGFFIESILRDELGFGDNDINEASFDDVNEASFGEYTFSLNEIKGSKDLIKELSFYDNAITYQSSDGQWYYFKFPTSPSSSTIDLYEDQIIFKKAYWTPTEWLCNSIKVNYHYDYARGNFVKNNTQSDSTSQGTTYQGENRTATIELNCPYYRHHSDSSPNSVNLFAQYFLANWKDPHLLVDFELLDISKFCLQEGDVITFKNMTFNPMGLGRGSATDYWSSFDSPRTKYFLITSCTRSLETGKVSYTAFQLHNL